MKRSIPSARTHLAFTLIELLTVIAIISILMAMLFPMITQAKEGARKQKAKQECLNIVAAVESYNTEYGQYPKIDPSAATTGNDVPDDYAGDSAANMPNRNSALFNTLRDIDRVPNSNHSQNPKRQTYYSANSVNNPAKPKEGFLETTGSTTGNQGSLYDPWGCEYNIIIDANSSGTIKLDDYYKDFSTENAPRVSVGAFSLGKDKQLGKGGDHNYQQGTDYSDDIVSWAGH